MSNVPDINVILAQMAEMQKQLNDLQSLKKDVKEIKEISSIGEDVAKEVADEVNQLKEISEKEKLYNKNSKMLQIVQSRNSFKRKIISTLIASIFFFLIITIATFVYYKRTLK